MPTKNHHLLQCLISAVFTLCLLMTPAMPVGAASVTVDSAEELADALYTRAPVIRADAEMIDLYLTEALTEYPVLGFDFNGYEGSIQGNTITMEMSYRGTEMLPLLPVENRDALKTVVAEAAVCCMEEVHILMPESMRALDFAALFEEAFGDSALARTMLSGRGWEIWVNGYTDAMYMSLKLTYEVDTASLRRYKQQTEEAAVRLAQSLFYEGAEDAVCALLAHDAIINRCVYDNTRFNETENHSAYGVLVNGHAVCEGYAEAFQLLMEIGGVECLYVEGDADGERHGWNMILAEDGYYHVDATWDDPVAESGEQHLLHDYFLVSDDVIGNTHFWERGAYPQAAGALWNAQRAQEALSLQTGTGVFALEYTPICSSAARLDYAMRLENLLETQRPDDTAVEGSTQSPPETTATTDSTETTADTAKQTTFQEEHTHSEADSASTADAITRTTSSVTDADDRDGGTSPAAIYVVWGILIVFALGIVYAKYLH